MSALSRGSRTKMKQMNGKADGTPREGMPTEEQDVTARSSPLPSLKSTMAAPNPQIFSSSLETASTATPPIFDENGLSSNDVAVEPVHIDPETGPESDGDDRSSSLSDIEDRPFVEGPMQVQLRSSPPPEEDDTEAETERLEESPHKLRKHQNVIFSATNNSSEETVAAGSQRSNRTTEAFALDIATLKQVPDVDNDGPEEEAMDPMSDISSLEDSADGNSRSVSPTSVSGRKRKRSSHDTPVESEGLKVNSLKGAAVDLVSNIANDNVRLEIPDLSPILKEEIIEDRVDGEDGLSAEGGDEPNSLLHPIIYTRKKSNCSGKRSGENELEASGSMGVSPGLEDADANDVNDAEESAAEDVEMEDVIPGMEAEAAMRNEEEVLKKKAALDSLSAIEKQFATLRDKLYEERLTHLNEELAVLNQSRPTHVDYLAMVECIDHRRDEKIAQAKIRLQYKLECLQRKSIAERAIAHSQYMQTVRDTRDKILEQANKEWYHIQRERRSCDEEDQQIYLYQFSTHRPHQIARQIAYNKEVSILSGIAKYRGFPAAPEIAGAKPNEIDEDLKKMGTPQFTAIRMATSLSNLSRQRPAAEEQFLEQNPWANPHHPAHHQNINTVHRQLSLHSRPLSPFATPAAQRRTADANALIGSASTIVALPSAQNSSMAPTPSSVDHSLNYALNHEMVPHRGTVQETPSHRNGHVEQGHLPSESVINMNQLEDNGVSQRSHPLTVAALNPADVQILSSPLSKSHVFASAFAGASSREPVSSPSRDADQREESLEESTVFKSFHSHLPRQLSVGTGVEHGNA